MASNAFQYIPIFGTMNMMGFDFLYTRLPLGMIVSLDNILKICRVLGNPEKSFDTIHVVGTNGKGSTSFYLAGILTNAGVRTGLYSSPHLVSLRERIRVNDIPISDCDLDRLLLQVKQATETAQVEASFFEVITAASFLYYKEKGVQCVIMEAGLGGRLDSTKVATGKITVLTSIGLEHTEILGDTESKILLEKLGILSPHTILIVGGISNKLISEAKEYASALGVFVQIPSIRDDIQVPNIGHHYLENASLALDAARVYLGEAYDDSSALQVLETRSWAGRMQKLVDAQGTFRYLLDGAHNTHAAKRLAETLQVKFPDQKFPCVFGALKDKDVGEMVRLLSPYVSEWHVTRAPYPRFREPQELAEMLRSMGLKVASVGPMSRSFLENLSRGSETSPVLITGSLYMIGAVIDILKDDFEELKFFRGMTAGTNEHH